MGEGMGMPTATCGSAGQRGQAVGIRHFNPLTLTSHLHWLSGVGGVLPS